MVKVSLKITYEQKKHSQEETLIAIYEKRNP